MDRDRKNWGKIAIIEKVWGTKRGSSKVYREAEAEYALIISGLEGDGEEEG
jgi:hypothetical protein